MKDKCLLFAVMFVTTISFSQIPTIKAVGGKEKSIDWNRLIGEYDKNNTDGGPDFFYNDCDQGLGATKASSTLKAQGKYDYKMSNLNDSDPRTAWVEGVKGYGIGEWFEVSGLAVNRIANGYQNTQGSWRDNSRVKSFKVYANSKLICNLELLDQMGYQHFELPVIALTDSNITYRFEIAEVYKGLKWDDVAISAVELIGCCFAETSVIQSETGLVPIGEAKELLNIDLSSGKANKADVINVNSQKHILLYKISTATKSIQVTADHPLNFEGEGFLSIKKLMDKFDPMVLAEFPGIMTWDSQRKVLVYEKIVSIEKKEGLFDTYSISEISSGNTYIVNGFITKTY